MKETRMEAAMRALRELIKRFTTRGGDVAMGRPPRPKVRQGNMVRWINERWVEVCDTCGGNCGQCGTSIGMGVPASIGTIVESAGMNKGLPVGLPRG